MLIAALEVHKGRARPPRSVAGSRLHRRARPGELSSRIVVRAVFSLPRFRRAARGIDPVSAELLAEGGASPGRFTLDARSLRAWPGER